MAFAEKKLLIHVLDNLLDPSDLCKSHMKSNEITHDTYTNVVLPCSVVKIKMNKESISIVFVLKKIKNYFG